MADSIARESGRDPVGSQTEGAGDPGLARGAAGQQRGAPEGEAVEQKDDQEARRETEQVLRPTSDGMGEGLTKDRS